MQGGPAVGHSSHCLLTCVTDVPSSGDDEGGDDEAEDTGETRLQVHGAAQVGVCLPTGAPPCPRHETEARGPPPCGVTGAHPRLWGQVRRGGHTVLQGWGPGLQEHPGGWYGQGWGARLGVTPAWREPGQGEADGFRQMGGTWDSLGKRGRTWVLSGCKCLVSMRPWVSVWPSGCPWVSGCLWVSGRQRGCECQGASVAVSASVAVGVRVSGCLWVSGCQRGRGCQGTSVAVSASVAMGASMVVGVRVSGCQRGHGCQRGCGC